MQLDAFHNAFLQREAYLMERVCMWCNTERGASVILIMGGARILCIACEPLCEVAQCACCVMGGYCVRNRDIFILFPFTHLYDGRFMPGCGRFITHFITHFISIIPPAWPVI